jgi:DNA-3-methyladenine glycosylase
VEPLLGIELMQKLRRSEVPRNLASGPGKLCQAFDIDRRLNGADICGKVLYVEDRGDATPKFLSTARIGVDYAGEWKDKPYRFLVRGSEFVSKG